MSASIFPFALRTQAAIERLALAFRTSFVTWPFRKRTRSLPVRRNFARAERSKSTGVLFAPRGRCAPAEPAAETAGKITPSSSS